MDRIWPSGNAVTPHPALLRHPGLCVWEARRSDLPHVRRRPSDYVREHVRFTTQPIEEVDAPKVSRLPRDDGPRRNLMFSTDYPHWSYDSPAWAIKRFPKDQRDRIMRGNAMALYGLPDAVKALPGEIGSQAP